MATLVFFFFFRLRYRPNYGYLVPACGARKTMYSKQYVPKKIYTGAAKKQPVRLVYQGGGLDPGLEAVNRWSFDYLRW